MEHGHVDTWKLNKVAIDSATHREFIQQYIMGLYMELLMASQ